MKFTHIADCHIGGWKAPQMKELTIASFQKAIDISIEKNVAFILISGDLFDNPLPQIETIKQVVEKLKELSDKKIPVYVIPGSHDFSPSGKTFLSVLEKAGLIINVSKGGESNGLLRLTPTIDKNTNTIICGILGKRGMLDKEFYNKLDREYIKEITSKHQGFKIFMFHNAISELMIGGFEKIETIPMNKLPETFDYYAGGHIHITNSKFENNSWYVYPGPTFPNNFSELEKLEMGSFVIYDTQNGKPELIKIPIKNIEKFNFDCNNKTPQQVEDMVFEKIKTKQFNNTIVLMRFHGKLITGKPSDINFTKIFDELKNKSAYFIMKNTSKLISEEFEEIKVEQHESTHELEKEIIETNAEDSQLFTKQKEIELIESLIKILSSEKKEEETKSNYEERIWQEVDKILKDLY